MIYQSSETLDYPRDASLTDLILNYNLTNAPPEKPAIIDGPTGEIVYTYASFRESVRKIAQYLQNELHLRRGTVVGLFSTNKVCVFYNVFKAVKTDQPKSCTTPSSSMEFSPLEAWYRL